MNIRETKTAFNRALNKILKKTSHKDIIIIDKETGEKYKLIEKPEYAETDSEYAIIGTDDLYYISADYYNAKAISVNSSSSAIIEFVVAEGDFIEKYYEGDPDYSGIQILKGDGQHEGLVTRRKNIFRNLFLLFSFRKRDK
ncbi:hypothetical protein FACS1894106_4900 [Spirochaetia bacterium]|nr:hypothetical protein FACS1894106_4900 [Spirochaetia bacterium]